MGWKRTTIFVSFAFYHQNIFFIFIYVIRLLLVQSISEIGILIGFSNRKRSSHQNVNDKITDEWKKYRNFYFFFLYNTRWFFFLYSLNVQYSKNSMLAYSKLAKIANIFLLETSLHVIDWLILQLNTISLKFFFFSFVVVKWIILFQLFLYISTLYVGACLCLSFRFRACHWHVILGNKINKNTKNVLRFWSKNETQIWIPFCRSCEKRKKRRMKWGKKKILFSIHSLLIPSNVMK